MKWVNEKGKATVNPFHVAARNMVTEVEVPEYCQWATFPEKKRVKNV